MIRIAIVEDSAEFRTLLTKYINDYAKEHGETLDIITYKDGKDIVWNYNSSFDIIFMDIQMEKIDGMSAAHSIRKIDTNVILIFITNMAQYAIQGYEVEAMNYILKPVNYIAFSQQLTKAIKRIERKKDFFINIMCKGSMFRIDISKIIYIESQGHTLLYHMEDQTYATRDTLKNVEQKLEGRGFSRCNNCYLVNLRYVKRVKENTAIVMDEELQVSRMRRKSFMNDLAVYIGGTK